MDQRPGLRVRARGLTWEVLESVRAGACERLSLRCVEGDMTGLEWEVYCPPEKIEPVAAAFDIQHPAPLPLWRLMHQAYALNELPDGTPFMAVAPGRLRVEPFQLVPLMRALDMPRPRLLLADGVGLGKTIQAGLIAAELIARRRAHRILIVAPSGPLLWQWEQEMRSRFGLKFTFVTSASELWNVRRAHELGANPFDSVPSCITSLDFAKQDHILEQIERSAWDLAIVDEAHHCVGPGVHGTREATQRRRLAEVVARRADGLLLLTATPHDGHDAHFASLIELLDPSLVDGSGGFVGRGYRRHMIRRLKAHIRDPRTGAPLFRRRLVQPVKVDVNGVEHEPVRAFHKALALFVVPRLQRPRGADDALAFVSLLKRSVSTISACVGTLRVVMDRIARRDGGETESKAARAERARVLRMWRRRVARFGTLGAADEAGQDAVEAESMAETLRVEPGGELARLIQLGAAAEANDPKLAALGLEARLIRAEHPRANILIYTEYTDSQAAAAMALRAEPMIDGEILTVGGQDADEARAAAASRFGESDGLILISTDSLAEGLNLHQHCFHLIHLDLPYNPNRLEQRNGRIDRYGQRREPEIRYLYLPGTFEERLLLHLISKYEKARASLDVMPDTLGVTAHAGDFGGPLIGGLSEDPSDMFNMDDGQIRTVGRAVEDIQPETVSELMREIDRAFDSFDLMAVAHGWHGARGINAGVTVMADPRFPLHDIASFTGAVIAAETGQSACAEGEIRLPRSWCSGLEDMPGFDPVKAVLRVTGDADAFRDVDGRSTAFLGRAHPLVARAVRHGCQLRGEVAVGRGERAGLLSTFVLEIQTANRVLHRQVVAILACTDVPPVRVSQWSDLAITESTVDRDHVWDRCFSSWADRAHAETDLAIAGIAERERETFATRHEALRSEEVTRTRRWLQVKANTLCGAYAAPAGDLFGAPAAGPAWRHQADPRTRLISFATDPETSAVRRREANAALETFQLADMGGAMPGPATYRAIGLLMLVPDDAV
ncbi:MAG: hypothetical protein EXR07_12880 [Acetobacteraceae bacterium]|nr:hypothetical protein [Acetobacteraceae bacterium]